MMHNLSIYMILPLLSFIFYIIYREKINNLLLRIIDLLIVWLLIMWLTVLIYIPNIELFSLILWTFWFFIWYLQFRKNKEYELINSFSNDNTEDSIKKFIDNFMIMSPIIVSQKNTIIILKREVSNIISDNETFEEFKKWITSQLLKIRQNASFDLLISILKSLKKDNLKNKERFKRDSEKQIFEAYDSRYDWLIKLLEDAENTILEKSSFYDKIIKIITP